MRTSGWHLTWCRPAPAGSGARSAGRQPEQVERPVGPEDLSELDATAGFSRIVSAASRPWPDPDNG